MRRFLCSLAFFFLLTAPALGWQIDSFDVYLDPQEDGSLLVREVIRVDFQGEIRHGIYRDVPLVTQDRRGIRRSIRLKFLAATDEQGKPWGVRLSREGVYRRIRLGDPDETFRSLKTFQILYKVERIFGSYPEHDELYWNATGDGWSVPILAASATVRLPREVEKEQLIATAYSGPRGSAHSDVDVRIVDSKTIHYAMKAPLDPLEGMTIVAGWPRGLVPMPTLSEKIAWFFEDNWVAGIPIGVFLLMLGIWRLFGKDMPRGPITVQYEPPDNISPGGVGTLMDDRVDMKDITATIIDLARRGYFVIEEPSKRQYKFIRQVREGPQPGELKPHEVQLLLALFQESNEVDLSDLENKFYAHLPNIHGALYEELTRQRYWWGRPDRVRQFYWLIAGVLLFVGIIVLSGEVFPGGMALIVSAAVVACFAPFMPKKTYKGSKALEQILGLEEFLRRTDQDRIKREKDPGALFERLFPYAMALGVANQWARAFEGIYQVQPTWYRSYNGNQFSPSDFSRRIDSASSRMASTMTSAPRSSGGSGFSGGFAGGGGGGGGGGAW